MKRPGEFEYGDGHTCVVRFTDMGSGSPKCYLCGAPQVRLVHSPSHQIDGKSCGYPDRWAHCWVPRKTLDRIRAATPHWLEGQTWREA